MVLRASRERPCSILFSLNPLAYCVYSLCNGNKRENANPLEKMRWKMPHELPALIVQRLAEQGTHREVRGIRMSPDAAQPIYVNIYTIGNISDAWYDSSM